MKKNGFTLIEVLVVLSISLLVLVSVGGVMTTSFKAKNNSEISGTVQAESQTILAELKKNILDADVSSFICPVGVGPSLSFTTKSGGTTSLWCDGTGVKVASVSAQNGTFRLSNNGVSVRNCNNFVSCTLNSGQDVSRVDFSLDIGITGGTGDQFWTFVSKVVPR